MKRLIVISLILAQISAFAQKHQVLFTIDTMPVYTDEFIYMYKKNNRGADSLPIEKYLQLFINYKLKVYQALREGYDKDSAFIAEYNKYLQEAAKPYLKNKALENKLLHEYYEKLKKEIRFSFLMKRFQKDTAKAYKELLEIRKKALEGEDFDKLVVKYSDDKYAPQTKGDVGYQTITDVPPVFAQYLWSHKVGDISMPIRFMNAYYILKIKDIRPNSGKVRVAQIFIALPYGAKKQDSIKAMKKLQTIDSLLNIAKIPFGQVAKKYSDDYISAKKDGDLGWISPGQTVPQFEKAIFSLKYPGQMAKVRTPMGYHIVKLIARRTIGSFDQERNRLLRYIKRTPEYRQVTESVIDSLKKAYGFKMIGSLEPFYKKVTTDIFEGKWHDSTLLHDNTVLFRIGKNIYTNADFAKYLEKTQMPFYPYKKNIKKYIDNKFDQYVKQLITEKYVHQLANDPNSEIYMLAKEFYEGLLLFNISNDKVWKRASQDSAALLKFYKKHQHNYDTLEFITILQGPYNKLKKLAKALKRKKIPVLGKELLYQLTDTTVRIKDRALISPSDEKYKKYYQLLEQHPSKRVFLIKDDPNNSILIYKNDKFSQIRGLVIADYQDYLEQQWIKQLRKQYNVKINQQALEQIKKQLQNSKQ